MESIIWTASHLAQFAFFIVTRQRIRNEKFDCSPFDLDASNSRKRNCLFRIDGYTDLRKSESNSSHFKMLSPVLHDDMVGQNFECILAENPGKIQVAAEPSILVSRREEFYPKIRVVGLPQLATIEPTGCSANEEGLPEKICRRPVYFSQTQFDLFPIYSVRISLHSSLCPSSDELKFHYPCAYPAVLWQ